MHEVSGIRYYDNEFSKHINSSYTHIFSLENIEKTKKKIKGKMKMNRIKISKLCMGIGLSSMLFVGSLAATPVAAFAATTTAIESNSLSTVNEQTVNKKIDNMSVGLTKYLESLDNVNGDIDVSKYFDKLSSNEKLNNKEFVFLASKGNKINSNTKLLGYSADKRMKSQLIKTVTTKNNIKVSFYNNGVFSIENKNAIKNKNATLSYSNADVMAPINSKNATLTTSMSDVLASTVWGQAYRDYYSYLGNRIFTVAVGCTFTYDGSKAGHGGNFTAYYTKGTLTSWQVSDWDKGHESDGDSYIAYCRGNFSLSFSVAGQSFTISNMEIQHDVTCDPDGQTLAEAGEV